jgi:hypothetical protein
VATLDNPNTYLNWCIPLVKSRPLCRRPRLLRSVEADFDRQRVEVVRFDLSLSSGSNAFISIRSFETPRPHRLPAPRPTWTCTNCIELLVGYARASNFALATSWRTAYAI